MAEKGRLSVGCIVALAVVAVLIIVGGVVGIVSESGRSTVLEPFKTHVGEYTSISGLKTITPTGGPYIKGKVITMDIEENEIDEIYFDLPSDLVAKTPEEVGTIIWLKWDDVLVGHYTPSGAGGYKKTCKVTVIDKAEAAIIGERTFEGSEPPSTKTSGGAGYGSKPTEDVIDYIRLLPRR